MDKFNYNHKDAVTVLPEGEYNAVLEKCEKKESKKGNEMAVLTWRIFPEGSGATPLVTDYIVFPAFTWKLKRLAQSLGREDDFKSERFQPGDYIGSSTRVFLEVQQSDDFDDKNGIKTYVAAKDGAVSPKFAPPSEKDAEIPF